MTMMRQRKIALIALQETKLTEKDKEIIEKENPGLALESNPNNSKAGTAFAINKDIVKWEKQEGRPWKHVTIEKGRISKIKLEWNDYKMTIINIYMPNTKTDKIETIKKLRNYLESDQQDNNLLLVGDFNFITDEQDRSPPHADDPGLTNERNKLEIDNDLVDGWRSSHMNDRQFTYAQANSLGRIDRMYAVRNMLKDC